MRAFLVLGPESSGTKLFTEILMGAGCIGDAGNEQRWDNELPVFGRDDPIVWRRSVPHGESYPDITGMVDGLRNVGCQVVAYVTTRDWTCILDSRVMNAGIINHEIASQRLQWAYPYIFSHLEAAKVPYAVVSYEALILYGEGYIKRMLKIFGLEMGTLPEIYNGNDKYYGDENTVCSR
jgi:hypothetical protein